MSAASKTKRGEAGVAKAAANPWRINGWAPDWQARKLGALHVPPAASGGSTTMRGMVGGMLAESAGFPVHGHAAKYDHMLEHAQRRVTHPLLSDNTPTLKAAE